MKRKRENNPIDDLTISKGKKTLTNVDHDTPTLTTFVSTSRAFTPFASTTSISLACTKKKRNLINFRMEIASNTVEETNTVKHKLLMKGEEVLIISQNDVYSIFTVITGKGKKSPSYIQQYFIEFCNECEIDDTILRSLKTEAEIRMAAICRKKNQHFEEIVQKMESL
ncbi:uncharacterized protein BX663DRAFT_562505 [Cokeromyces recurvatus]|uniref:uncharacterized protein n=1 Tax=Cokeromyces recurvatus TaxID=90255 RepID=UPI0022206612|nr:uncharacterized protein BX663DRAFT_562505 [Cokeromyces recurvatus]KAI7901175.1 hypothetical protein BX663DRAFT_562505 [Cokeromyces recurvatus]